MIDTRYLPNKYTNMEPLHLKKKTKIPYLIGWQHHEASLFYIVDQSKANYKMVVELHSTLRHIQDKITKIYGPFSRCVTTVVSI